MSNSSEMADVKVEKKVECFTEKEEKQPILIIFKIPIGGLASYTPSKIQIGSSFELGVSRTAPTVQATPPTPPVPTERAEEEYLRPADESETVTWSAESTSDMLF
ncbi:uncharacterized protein [Palaemon carinicauda]|uniref:uncharacterized protein n=1 Tax=Palaemon carinicauda TaxID=392227 RepID=UPI0035B60B92